MLHSAATAQTGTIKGIARDKINGEALPGVTIVVEGTTTGAAADIEGNFIIPNIKPGTYSLKASYISYDPVILSNIVVKSGETSNVEFDLTQGAVELQDVMVSAEKKTNTEASVINAVKMSPVVSIGISSQQILRSQDKDASEVIRRLPGTSIVDDRFIIVRGLAQRYNGVWLNNAATPSTEADVKAFSFDVIPASIIDHMMIIKSPSPDLPADFSGGFIRIATITPPEKNSLFVSFGTGYSEGTTGGNFLKSSVNGNNFLGFSNNYDLPRAMPEHLGIYENAGNPAVANRVTELGRSLGNTWAPVSSTAFPDQKFSAGFSKRFRLGSQTIGNITSITYSNSNNFDNVEVNNYAIYDFRNDKSRFVDQSDDRQYTRSVKTGIMHNWIWYAGDNHKLEFRNLLNEIGQSRVTLRNGRDWSNEGRYIRSTELKNLNRAIYSGQLAGNHEIGKISIDWVGGYSFSNKNEPDIRRYRYIRSDTDPTGYFMLFSDNADLSSQSRMWLGLSENLYSLALNIKKEFDLNGFSPALTGGIYYEDKNRSFDARNFGYAMGSSNSVFRTVHLPVEAIFAEENINQTTGIRLSEITSLSDSYEANNNLIAGFLAAKIPFHSSLNLYGGVRIEKNRQTLSSYRQGTTTPVDVVSDTINLFPSAILSYNLNTKNVIRLAYGLSVNRPEFRELAPFYFVDFDMNAGIYGNPNIKQAYIHNYDLRYEYYPSPGENLNVGFFYKRFSNPIEMVIMGNSPTQYSYQNVGSAYSYGIEADVRKTFGFTPDDQNLSLVMNAAFIRSRIDFAVNDLHPDRPMQGQSPFMLNAGLFYYSENSGFMVTALYNIIGKRIVAVGLPSPNDWESIPDILEMPRNVIDLLISKKIGKHFEVKGSFKDLLNEAVIHAQIIDTKVVLDSDMKEFHNKQVTRLNRPGRNLSLSVSYKF